MVDLPPPDTPATSRLPADLIEQHRRAVGIGADRHPVSVGRCQDRAQVRIEHELDQLDHPLTASAVGDQIGRVLHRRQGVGDRDRAAADREKRMVVLRVAHRHDIMAGEAELMQRRIEPAGLVDAGRQDHHRALVEGDLQLQPQLADRVEDDRLHRLPGRNDAASNRQRLDTAFAQTRHKGFRRRIGDRHLPAGARLVEQRPVLDDGEVAQGQFWEDPLQVGQLAPGHQDQPAARFLEPPQGVDRRSLDHAILGQSTVIVGGERKEIHTVSAPANDGHSEETHPFTAGSARGSHARLQPGPLRLGPSEFCSRT